MNIKSTVAALLGLSSSLFISGCQEPQLIEEKEEVQNQEVNQEVNQEGDHDHNRDEHDHTPHLGTLAPFHSTNGQSGFVELKLHDDKGDLELWLTEDKAGKKPFNLPLDTVISVTFLESDKTVQLLVRNREKNEDESGNPTISDGKTNYFIFPGDTGADPSFLLGKHFSSNTVLSFSSPDSQHATPPFVLRPHTH
ncbi:hypothetical protein OAI07_00270 [Akkermansiaceae bacterium]|nr:hypothetical protein [Akkermansiaceae bacterium]